MVLGSFKFRLPLAETSTFQLLYSTQNMAKKRRVHDTDLTSSIRRPWLVQIYNDSSIGGKIDGLISLYWKENWNGDHNVLSIKTQFGLMSVCRGTQWQNWFLMKVTILREFKTARMMPQQQHVLHADQQLAWKVLLFVYVK